MIQPAEQHEADAVHATNGLRLLSHGMSLDGTSLSNLSEVCVARLPATRLPFGTED